MQVRFLLPDEGTTKPGETFHIKEENRLQKLHHMVGDIS
jgi:hypothetical protein